MQDMETGAADTEIALLSVVEFKMFISLQDYWMLFSILDESDYPIL